MNLSLALQYLAALLTLPTQVQTKSNILAICVAANLSATSFVLGDPSERWPEIMARAMDAWGNVPAQAVAGNFLDLATDPGDVGPLGADLSADQTPRPGFLSALGQGWFGTTRGNQTFASTTVTVTNTRSDHADIVLAPFTFTAESTDTKSDGGSPTYRNTVGLTLHYGVGVPVTFVADQIGSYGSASAGSVTVAVTQTYGTTTLANSTVATGFDREARLAYIDRCRTYADSLAPGGPLRAYIRAMNTAIDGTLLQRYDGSGPVNLTSAYVSPSSSSGVVTMYVYGAGMDQVDADTANANMDGLLLGVITSPIGCLPDTVTLAPYVYSSGALPDGTPGAALALATTIAVTYSVKIRASQVVGGATPGSYSTGGSPPAPVAAVFSAIAGQLATFLPGLGVGALDQTAGAGVVYTADLPSVVRGTQAGLYDPVVTAPSGPTTAIALGHYASAGTITGTLVVVAG